MVYLDDADEFAAGARGIFEASPDRTRCTIKYRHEDQHLCLKVTDDVHCLKFKTKDQADLKKVERVMSVFLRWSLCPQTDADSLDNAVEAGDETYKAEIAAEKDRLVAAKNAANQNKNKSKGKKKK